MQQQPILVTGATGNTGRHVVAQLLREGHAVRALSRDPARASLPEEVQVVAGDTTRADDVRAAARDALAAYLVWPGTDPSAEGAAEVVSSLTDNVPRIVYLSSIEAQHGGVWGSVERIVRDSADEWTFLRASGLAVNTLAWADEIRHGVVRAPFGGLRRSLVHERDVAAVAVRSLVDAGHIGRTYDVTGPERLSQVEQVRVIGREIGRPVEWDEQSLDEARVQLAAEVGDEFAAVLLDGWAAMVDAPEPVSSDVLHVLGRPALSFAQWAADHRADFSPRADDALESPPA